MTVRARGVSVLAISSAAALAWGCSPAPAPRVAPPAATPAPAPSPTAAPTPAAIPTPAFADVPEPRLDVALGVDRASLSMPYGDYLLRSGGRVERILGPLTFAPSSTAAAAPLFAVQAGSYGTRDAAEQAKARLASSLSLPAEVAETAGRFAVRAGEPLERKAAEVLLARVRRDAAPDAFLVGAGGPGAAAATLELSARDGFRQTSRQLASPAELYALDAATLPFEDARYRGHFVVRATGRGTLHVVDRVGLEEYLRGVVPGEMGPKVYDEPEALKAQAVAARSYALKHRGDFAAEGYDLCSTPRCQVYGGATVEQPLSSEAVDATAGEVLLYRGEIADTLFTSTCGGRTEVASEVFPGYAGLDVPYLASVACSGETPSALASRVAPPKEARAVTALGLRGRALVAAAGRKGTAWSDLKAARALLRDRLGLTADAPPKNLLASTVYEDLAGALGIREEKRLLEDAELAKSPSGFSLAARRGLALAQRFQLGGGAALPEGTMAAEEAAGLWASFFERLGTFEESDARFIGLEGDGVVLKSAKGRAPVPVGEALVLFEGGPDLFRPAAKLSLYAGDRLRVFLHEGRLVALAALPAPAAGLYERDSSWIHWTRTATGAELMSRLKARDASRRGREVLRLRVLSRGVSGRATKVEVETDAGRLVLSGLEVRFALSLPETLFTVVAGHDEQGERRFTFFGRGWGHGVGLCQNGAFGMALSGRTYREILGHYYPGATIGPAPAAR